MKDALEYMTGPTGRRIDEAMRAHREEPADRPRHESLTRREWRDQDMARAEYDLYPWEDS